jgi:hypothetical protein
MFDKKHILHQRGEVKVKVRGAFLSTNQRIELINDTSLKLVENPLGKCLTSLYYKESIPLPHN